MTSNIKTGIMLVNTGTPAAPTEAAIRQYLSGFLLDRRIVNIPPLLWKPILQGIVLRKRPPKTAKKYQAIWTSDGSPYTLAAQGLEQLLLPALLQSPALGRAGLATDRLSLRFAHRYGQPSIAGVLKDFQQQGIQQLLVLPLYPQRAHPTTDSVHDELQLQLALLGYQPETRFIWDYHDNLPWVKAVAGSIKAALGGSGSGSGSSRAHLLFSFHSEPLKDLRHGDPYRRQVESSVAAICAELELSSEQYSLSYQSRFEDAQRWLGPFLPTRLNELGQAGVQDIRIVCPGFSLDCIETLYDIDIELRQQSELPFRYIPCLNASPSHVAALAKLLEAQLLELIHQ